MNKLDVSNKPALISEYRREIARNREFHFLHRLHCVLLVAQGCNCYQVSEWSGNHPCTVERWVHNYQEHGLDGLRDEEKMGRPCKVSADLLKRLEREISSNPIELGYDKEGWDGKQLQTHIQHRYSITLSVRQCQRLLSKLRHNATSHSVLSH